MKGIIPTDLGEARKMMNCLPFAEPGAGIEETQILIRMMIEEIAALRKRVGYEGIGFPNANEVTVECRMCGHNQRVLKADYFAGAYGEGDRPEPIKCPECGVYVTDGSVCEGCLAYREHQQ